MTSSDFTSDKSFATCNHDWMEGSVSVLTTMDLPMGKCQYYWSSCSGWGSGSGRPVLLFSLSYWLVTPSRNLSLRSLQHDVLCVLGWSVCPSSWPLFSKARATRSKASPTPLQLSEHSSDLLNSFFLVWDNYSPIFVLPFLNNSYKLYNSPLGCHWSLPGNCAGHPTSCCDL